MAVIQRKLLLIAILVLAAVSRFVALGHIPPGIYPDEAINGNEGLEAAQTGDFKLFYPANNGREGLWINLTGLAVRYLGASQFGLRFWSAVFGTLAVFLIYLLASEIFSTRAGLFAAFLLATSFWHLNFSRMDFRAILVPTFSLAAIYFLLRAWRSLSLVWAISGGLIYGLGFHTYIAYRFTPLVVLALCAGEFYRRRKAGEVSRRWTWITAAWLSATFVAALPLGVYFLENPDDFFGRAQQVSIFDQPDPARTFVVSLLKTAAMFNIQGDHNPRHNLPDSPELAPVNGLLFLCGIALAVFGRARSWMSCVVLPVWLGAMILPGALTWQGVPHALRTIGAIPPVFLLAALGADAVFELLATRKAWQWAFLIVVAATGLFEYYRYFGVWANQPSTREAFTHNLVSIGDYLNALPDNTPRFVVATADPMPSQTVIFVTQGHPAATYLSPEQARIVPFPHGSVIVPLADSEPVFEILRQRGIAISEDRREEFTAGVVR